jgi:hypothetical protein
VKPPAVPARRTSGSSASSTRPASRRSPSTTTARSGPRSPLTRAWPSCTTSYCETTARRGRRTLRSRQLDRQAPAPAPTAPTGTLTAITTTNDRTWPAGMTATSTTSPCTALAAYSR